MQKEIEASFLDIDKDEYHLRLKQAGATMVQPEKLMRRSVFDTGEQSFLRVRDEGRRITMTYKKVNELSLLGVDEINVNGNNYDDTVKILRSAGLKLKSVQETFREEWKLDDAEITIDTWPALPAYTEIEGPNAEKVETVVKKLGFSMEDAFYGSVDEIYHYYYGVDQEDVNYCPAINFEETPIFLKGLELIA